MRTYKPNDVLDATNSKLVGVSIDRKGNVTHIRVKFTPKDAQAPRVIVKSKALLNTMGIQLQRLGL
jgi:hypothetical protein